MALEPNTQTDFRTPDRKQVRLLGVRFDALRERQVVEHVIRASRSGRGGWIVTPNLDHLRRCRYDAPFRAMVEEADLVVADGMPLIWASHLQGTPLPQRVAGSSLVDTLACAAAQAGVSLFLLGGNRGAAEGAADVLQRKNPQLRIAGWHYPPMGFEHDAAQMAQIVAALRRTDPGIVYVGLGSPKQEILIRRLMGDFPHIWWVGVGISLSFLSGDVRRAPRWVQRLGLEWAHRLCQEPRRLFKRYIVDGLPFGIRLFFSAGLTRFSSSRHAR